MQKIKFIADSASDIPDDLLLEYGIDMPSIPIAIDGEEYFERRSFTILEFYKLLGRSSDIPKTSRVPMHDFLSCYIKAYEQGFTDIITVTINACGSGTNESAHAAATTFFEENPEAKGKIKIHIMDSGTYTMAYGYPVVEGARMAREGKSVKQILAFLDDFFGSCEIYLACYTLEYAKKSGRITAASAFVGEVLGVRPIISLIGGKTKVVAKVRGDRQLIPQLIKCYEENRANPDAFTMVICGEVSEYGLALQQALQKSLGRKVPIYNAGASIVINAGPRIAAIVCRGKKRR